MLSQETQYNSEFSINDSPMGSVIPPADKYSISGKVVGGAAIDYVDIIKSESPPAKPVAS